MKLLKNDTIKVLSGDDKGRTGKVTKLYPKENKVLVDGLNTYKKHLKNQSDQDSGGVVTLSRPLHVSKLQLICPQCHKPTRVTYSGTGSNKVRLCSKCHKPLTITTPKKTKK
jgi:large subunit ribosomal protein L24